MTDFQPHFVTGLLGPLLTDPAVSLVKAFYDRPLLDVSAAGGGRVTELAARPLLGAFFPELAGVVQPLAGEYAARRDLLERLPFAAGYGLETGLLIDAWRLAGLEALAQVDLGQRTHGHQDTAALGRMAATILHTVLHRAESQKSPLWTTLTQFRRDAGGTIEPVEEEIAGPDRPPMITVPGYRRRWVPALPAVRPHLSCLSPSRQLLREAGLTRTRVEGTSKYVRLRLDEVAGRFPGLLDSVLRADPARV